jgi:FixJ family two-component response regulator
MKTEPFSMESSLSIRVPVFKVSKQAKSKRALGSAVLPTGSSAPSSGRPQSSRNALVSQAEGEAGAEAASTVLFVSDDDYLRSTMCVYLEQMGFLVRSCADAARIPDLFFRTQKTGSAVDLLLIDVHAMGVAGLRLAAELTRFEPELPVVIIAPPGTEECDLAGFTRRGWKFLNKPVLLSRLLGVIRSALEPRRPVSPASLLRSGKIQRILQ